MPAFQLSLGYANGHNAFAALDKFTRGYVEGLFFLFASDPDDGDLEGATFSDLSVQGLQRIIADCLEFQAKNSEDLGECEADLEQCGHDFAMTSCRSGVGFWSRPEKGYYTEEQAERLTASSHDYPEYGTSFDFRDLLNEIAMSPKDAWLYAAQWGSAMHSTDPGACMYGFDERFCVQSEKHRADCLNWIAGCRADVEASPDDFEPGELDKLSRLASAVRDAANDDASESRREMECTPVPFAVTYLAPAARL